MNETVPIEGAYAFDNLVGVPSYHWEPIFGRIAIAAVASFSPDVVALELPPDVEPELAWAASCWPGPVVSALAGVLFPFVPGDSIVETYRLARSRGIEVALVDQPLLEQSTDHDDLAVRPSLLGPEFSPRSQRRFLDPTDALLAAAGPPSERTLARESHMAATLRSLMLSHRRVLWVGGMAHWERLLAHLSARAPATTQAFRPAVHSPTFRRMRLAPSTLFRLTGRLPWLVASYARDPDAYDEVTATQRLALKAARGEGSEGLVVTVSGAGPIGPGPREADAATAPVDVARMLQYARNLSLTGGIRERPAFEELLLAAAGTISPRYAGRIYELGMAESTSAAALEHDALDWEIVDGHEQFRCGDEVLAAKPYQRPRGALITRVDVRRRAREEPYVDLPAPAGGKKFWNCYPEDDEHYLAFVDYALRRASQSDRGEPRSSPFRLGLRDGIDVRATARDWARGKVHVREQRRGRLNFTNAAIDWTSTSERSDILLGLRSGGGWTDPSFKKIGSCSRVCDTAAGTSSTERLVHEPQIERLYREFTLASLDLPTTARSPADEEGKRTFYDQVIMPLVGLQKTAQDDLYGWLNIMFRFCAGRTRR